MGHAVGTSRTRHMNSSYRVPIRHNLPFPKLIVSYVGGALILWVLIRVALLFFGLSHPSAGVSILLAGLAVTITWFEHNRSRENFFFASLGARLRLPIALAFVAILVAELIV
jgi:hypothetical protein